MCCPSSEELLGPFMSLLRTREVLYPQMCQLRGKLELIKGNIEAKQYRAEPANEALLDFHDGMLFYSRKAKANNFPRCHLALRIIFFLK